RESGGRCGAPRLEAALDLAEDGDVAALFVRDWALQVQLLLVLAIHHVKAEIELWQHGVAEHAEATLLGFGNASAARRAELGRAELRGRGRNVGGRRLRHLLKGKRRRAAKRQRHEPGDGERPTDGNRHNPENGSV